MQRLFLLPFGFSRHNVAVFGAIAGLFVLSCCIANARAGMATYEASEDNFMYSAPSWQDSSWGQWTTPRLAAGSNNTTPDVYRTLLRFDPSDLAGRFDKINSATLTLTHDSLSKLGSADLPLQLYLIDNANAAWIEGTGSASNPAPLGDPTWSHLAYNTVSWAGGPGIGSDASSPGLSALLDTVTITNPSGSVSVGDTIDFEIDSPAGLAALESWANGGTNAGLFVKTDEAAGQNAVLVGSAEHGNAARRPQLSIAYSDPKPAVWLDATAIDPGDSSQVRDDGGALYVQRWEDQYRSNDAVQTTEAAQPQYVAAGLNGQPVVRFDGSNHRMRLPDSLLNGEVDITTFTVVSADAVGSNTAWSREHGAGAGGGDDFGLLLWTSNNTYVRFDDGTPTSYRGDYQPGTTELYTTITDAGGSLLWDNGLLANPDVSGTNAPLLDDQTFYLGARATGGTRLDGDIAEFIIFETALNDELRQAVEVYLNEKWDLGATGDLGGSVVPLSTTNYEAVYGLGSLHANLYTVGLAVPEPGSLLLLGLGLISMLAVGPRGRRSRRAA